MRRLVQADRRARNRRDLSPTGNSLAQPEAGLVPQAALERSLTKERLSGGLQHRPVVGMRADAQRQDRCAVVRPRLGTPPLSESSSAISQRLAAARRDWLSAGKVCFCVRSNAPIQSASWSIRRW